MAKGDSSDIIMMFQANGSALTGESKTQLTAQGRIGAQMLTGFVPGKMFEIESFGFGVGDEVKGDDKDDKKKGRNQQNSRSQRSNRLAVPKKVTVQPVTFTRRMDRASPELLQHFINRTNFDRAALVKRKSAGSAAAGEPYLRFDFKGVLISEANWSDDEPIKEEYTFYARAITMRYRPQNPDGTLGAIIPGFWSMAPFEKIESL